MQKIFTVCLLLIAGVPALAREWPVPRGDSREPNPYVYDPKMVEKIPKAFLNDAPAVYLYAGTTYRLEEDNTIETTVHEIVRINSRKALDQLGEHRSIVYAPAYEKVTLHIARVHKPNGQIVEVEPKHVQLRDTGTDFLVYDTDKQVIISMPAVDVNDVIEVKWTTRGKHPEYGDYFFQRYYFGDDRYPIVADHLTLVMPEKKKLIYAPINPDREKKETFIPQVTAGKQGVLYEWKVNNRPQITQYDRSPSRELNRPGIALTTMTDWEQVAQWKKKTRVNCWECTEDLKKIVAEQTKGLKTETEKAAALATWVKRNIRYVSAGEKHDFIPHPPSVIVKNRFGDCKDTSQLLAVLLKEAGIRSALVTLGMKGDGQVMEEVPSPWGTHAILLVYADGKEHWVDSTVNLAGWNLLPEVDCDRVCYVLSDTGIALRRTPKLTAQQCQILQNTVVELDYEGTSTNTRTMKFIGLAAYERRDDWYGVPSGQRRRSYTSELQDAAPRSQLVQLEIDEAKLEDINVPVEAKSVFKIFGHVSGNPPEGSITDSPVWARILSVSVDMDRKTPIDLEVPFYSEHTYKIQLPPGRRFTQQIESVSFKSLWGSFAREVLQSERTLTITMKTQLDRTLVEPADFEAFRLWQEEISSSYRVYFAVRPLDSKDQPNAYAPDIDALQNLLKKNPKDLRASMALVELLMLSERIDDASQVIDQAVKFYPKNRELLRLAAQSSREPKRVHRFYGELTKQKPDDFEIIFEYGEALLNYQETSQLEKILEPIFKSEDEPAKAEAHLMLARGALLNNKSALARKALEQAKKFDANLANDRLYLQTEGRLLLSEKQYEQAAQTLTKAINPDEPSAGWKEVVLAWSLAKKREQTLAALAQWQPHLVDPDDIFFAANTYQQWGRYTEAKYLAEKLEGPAGQKLFHRMDGLQALSEKRYSDTLKAWAKIPFAELSAQEQSQMVLCWLRTGQLNTLIDMATRVKLSPSDEKLVRQLSQRKQAIEGYFDKNDKTLLDYLCAEYLICSQKDTVAGEILLQKVQTQLPEHGFALALRAWRNLESGRLRQALAEAEAAVKSLPKEYFVYLVRGRIEFERNGATEDLLKAVELSQSQNAQALYWLAYAYSETGKITEAKQSITKALQLEKDDPLIQALAEKINNKK